MDWSGLRDFVAVADTGSLSAAAVRLNVSQPTVGRRIEQLETELKAVLFIRTPRGLTLTPAGENIIEIARRMEEEALTIERTATGVNQQLEGTVRISLTEDLGVGWLPDKLPMFHERYPNLVIQININNKNVNLLRREADIAVRLARPKQVDLVARKVEELHFGLYASRAYLVTHGPPKTVRDLSRHYHVGFDEDPTYPDAIRKLERLFGRDHIRHRTNSHLGQIEASAAGLGIGALCCLRADADQRLQRVLPDIFNYVREIWLVVHTDISRSARIRAVFDFIGDTLNEDTPRLRGTIENLKSTDEQFEKIR